MRRMWIFAALAALLLSGCGAKTQASEPWEELGVSEAAWTVIEDFSERYSALDADGLRYDEALEAVQSYLDGGLGQAEALGALNSALEAVEAELEAAEPVSLDAGLEEALRELGISPTEYEAFANSRPNDLQNQQLRLSSLLFYLENAGRGEAALEDLRFTLAANASEQESLRGYFYYGCLNYWFTGLDEAELELLRSSLIDGLESLPASCPSAWAASRTSSTRWSTTTTGCWSSSRRTDRPASGWRRSWSSPPGWRSCRLR